MSVLKKNASLFDRDENSELIPQEVPLIVDEDEDTAEELRGITVKVIPMTRGEVKKLFASKDVEASEQDLDGDIIFKYCKEPQYTKEEIEHLKPMFSGAIVDVIFRESGLDFTKTRKKAIEKKETEFKKN